MSGKASPLNTAHKKQRMLKALLANHGTVTQAAKAAGITPQTHYNWYKEDDEYRNHVNDLKVECHEEFKQLVMAAVRKKIQQGNTTIIALCFKTALIEEIARLERHSNYKPRLNASIKVVSHPSQVSQINYSKDPFTQMAVKEYEDILKRQREQGNRSSPSS